MSYAEQEARNYWGSQVVTVAHWLLKDKVIQIALINVFFFPTSSCKAGNNPECLETIDHTLEGRNLLLVANIEPGTGLADN